MRTFVLATLCFWPLAVARASTVLSPGGPSLERTSPAKGTPSAQDPLNGLPPRGSSPIKPRSGPTSGLDALLNPVVDVSGAQWRPAAEGNFDHANRPQGQPIDTVVIHDIEGTPQAALDIFGRVGAKVSAHYVVGADGTLYQTVRERDIAWHAGNYAVNQRAIGIETEGYAYRPGFYNSAQYEAEARLVRDITTRYNIPRDRTHIIGHAEVPNPQDPTKFGGRNGHTDPGPYWDWNAFMTLVRSEARVQGSDLPKRVHPGELVPFSITFANAGDDPWFANRAPNTLVGLQSSGATVYLGTTTGASSALYNAAGWVSPRYAAGLSGTDVAPGGSAQFGFIVQGPRVFGAYREDLRLWSVPTAAQGGTPVAFGDAVHVALNVVPWELSVPVPNELVSYKTTPQAPKWISSLPVGGWWELAVKPARLPGKRMRLAYSVTTDSWRPAPKTSDVEVRPGDDWHVLGRYSVPDPGPNSKAHAIVTLPQLPKGLKREDAGAVRWTGPFPDGVSTAPDANDKR